MKPETYIYNAYCIARQSKDKENQHGAVLVSSGDEIIGMGVNNFAIGVHYNLDRINNNKGWYFEHAIRAAIYQAARAGNIVFGSTVYCTWAGSCDCMRAIINTGVRHVIIHQARMDKVSLPFQVFDIFGKGMLEEAGVTIEYFTGPLEGCPDILVNGKPWNPNSGEYHAN